MMAKSKRWFLKLKEKLSTKPIPDMALCQECRWEGAISDCIKGEDGNWESGYYLAAECPECGGAVEYYFSDDEEKMLED
jgi:hypothetical protein